MKIVVGNEREKKELLETLRFLYLEYTEFPIAELPMIVELAELHFDPSNIVVSDNPYESI